MGFSGFVSLLIIGVTSIISYKGFASSSYYAGLEFEVEKILVYRDYKRLITSAFLHVNWQHFIFNMVSLLFFGFGLESELGPLKYFALYILSAVGGNLLALIIHRKNPTYSSVGSSGAINGVIFAAIATFPGLHIFFLPGWVFGVLFILFSIYAIRSGKQNIGHETHLAGALIGMLFAIVFKPSILQYNAIPLLLLFLPTLAFMIIIITKPQLLMVNNYWFMQKYNYTVDDYYNAKRQNHQQELDRILDKINQQGMSSLSRKERASLEEFSKK